MTPPSSLRTCLRASSAWSRAASATWARRWSSTRFIKAVGFTGSLAGGRALFNLCAARPEPIPFFGELGSVNPMFLLPAALAARGEAIAKGWAGSLTMGAGQFCTNPGIAVVIDGPDADAFVEAAKAGGRCRRPADHADRRHRRGLPQAAATGLPRGPASASVLTTTCDLRNATPYLFEVSGADWLARPRPGGRGLRPAWPDRPRAPCQPKCRTLPRSLQGQLTCTLHLDDATTWTLAASLVPILERKAGRILANGFPTGVEVVDAQVHGGPYPASTNFGATSVGTMSIRRWLRPVAYQNMPDALLPQDWSSDHGQHRHGRAD